MTSKTICGAVLDAPGRVTLKRLAGTDDFRSPDEVGESFSVKLAAEYPHDDEAEECFFYKAGDKTGHPVIVVDFEVRAK
ncbi:hypothetical protein [Streptomyces niveus]|uniref:hypothetical protein n=1 Tax=Streptomyces niveus TaxID=193462 RepID=UPI0036D41FA7